MQNINSKCCTSDVFEISSFDILPSTFDCLHSLLPLALAFIFKRVCYDFFGNNVQTLQAHWN